MQKKNLPNVPQLTAKAPDINFKNKLQFQYNYFFDTFRFYQGKYSSFCVRFQINNNIVFNI